MGRIIFINPFASTRISGGIKATYQHAELLTELGYQVIVFQPSGPPTWCSPHLRALVSDRLDPAAGDILVFPETLNGWLADYAKAPNPATKIMFCQNQFYMISYGIDAQGYRERRFAQFIVPSEIAKCALETIIGLSNVVVVPYCIDAVKFRPRDKVAQIVTVPWKYPHNRGIPAQADMIRTMLRLKYPHLASVSWQLLVDKSEDEVADIMARSAVFLSLCYMEACPLAPLEAMASGCVVVGYTGTGGLEYATPQNGFWFSPEQMEEVTDTIALAIDGLMRGDPRMIKMREAGRAAAARFTRERTKAALQQVYGGLQPPPG
jgi:glycosyltransferase involved in cell wall biosynthesis